MIDPTSSLPRYAQLEDLLATQVLNGTLPVGSKFPTEDTLIATYGVSRTTVRKAIQNLVARGLAVTHHGRGTFVATPRIAQPLTSLSGFVEDMEALGRTASARVIGSAMMPASEEIARQLHLPPGATVARIERVRLADGVPLSFDETFLPAKIGEQVIVHDLAALPIFTILEDHLGLPLSEATYAMEAIAAPVGIAEHLHLLPGAPIFRIERTSFGPDGTPLDYERLSYRGDLVRFETRLSRRPGSGAGAAS